ncbi:hypothetical protein GCM10011608_03580 [Micromonospora sonchi]|uniref:Uncharacterized protein n=1 Tax=Micromonospora sonchi TaxID=1763543 RepID=A0A917WQW4_9ACTN|nr:hypothetical protein GCM10011608_03580 [Micromonospora sonchi]
MRFVWALVGMLLLAVGTTALVAAAALGLTTGRTAPDGVFTARIESVRTPGHAVVVTDLDALVRREVPFASGESARFRLDARTPDGPAFVGLAPTDEAQRWLAAAPHAVVQRMALARGSLPVRLEQVDPAEGMPPAVPAAPAAQTFWVRAGTGVLEWSPADLADRRLSLVLMRPDGGPDLGLDLRAELRAGWIAPLTWASLTGGILLVTLAALILLRPIRPREIIFVVEPDQVPVLAGRLGVSSLSGLGVPPPPGPRALSPEPPAPAPGPRALSPVPRSPSPGPHPLSPVPRSPSPAPRSLSAVPRSPSPAPRSPSPGLHPLSPSPVPRPPAPGPHLLSPVPRPPAPGPHPEAERQLVSVATTPPRPASNSTEVAAPAPPAAAPTAPAPPPPPPPPAAAAPIATPPTVAPVPRPETLADLPAPHHPLRPATPPH